MNQSLVDLLAPALTCGRVRIDSPAAGCSDPHEILADARAGARALLDRGVRPGEPVHVVVDNRPGDLAAFIGVWLAGAVAVPVHREAPAIVREELQRRTGARLTIDLGMVRHDPDERPRARVPFDDAALIVFTSGTTGRPKGVVLGHARLARKLEVLDRVLGLQAGDQVVLPLRLTFIFGIWVALLTVLKGAGLTLLARFSRNAVADALDRPGAVLATVPTMLRMLMAGEGAGEPRTILTGGELLPAALARTIGARWPGARLFDLYGLTETGSCDFCLAPSDQPAGFGTVGHPTSGVTFEIARADGRPVRDGDPGELRIRSPFGMLGYLGDPVLTTASFAGDFFRTGDLARRDPAGRVRIVGRIKEMISRGATKIAPAEVEALFLAHPGIGAALCAGVPDPVLGEAIHVLVVPKAGVTLDQSTLPAWAAARIERDKLPDVIRIVDGLPAGPTGKLDRQAVARLAGLPAGREGRDAPTAAGSTAEIQRPASPGRARRS